ncbi:unnamed protein product [Urochloa humidicola]
MGAERGEADRREPPHREGGDKVKEYNLEKPGKSFAQDSWNGTKLDNFVPFRQEKRAESNHWEITEMCKQTRSAILGASKLDQKLMKFLLEHGSFWELEDVPEEVLLIMKTMTDSEGSRHGWTGLEKTLPRGNQEIKVQNAGVSDLGACFKFQ